MATDTDKTSRVRHIAVWFSVLGGLIVISLGTLWIFYRGTTDEILQAIVREHFRALYGIPACAIVALVLVFILRVAEGPIEFEAPFGFKFRGASGPIVLWVLVFLACVVAALAMW